MSVDNQGSGAEVIEKVVNKDDPMGDPEQDGPVVNSPENLNSGQNEESNNKRQANRQVTRRGGFKRGGWRGFNQDRSWAPPYPYPSLPRPLLAPRNYNMAHCGMGFMWGRGFGPAGPPIQRPASDNMPLRYLMRCGVPKDKLKNLPRDFLQLIHPEHCSLCDVQLENFDMSREHYISKYHFKQQKKWIFQQYQPLEGGYQRPKQEPPLKSRDIYCELCDVQITSKVHADSHYTGKPHRSIVDGRKVPKNARLQKKGMEYRVELLIRRERKHLKPIVEEPKTEQTAIQPELFCEICKTSVTCSEQMRMHLNGRKHLNKEKQHILKMMRGEAPTNDKQKPEEANTDKGYDPESQDDDDDDDEDDEDKYDWGNGSGAWDDPQ